MKYPLASIKAYDVYVFLALFLFDRGMLISFFSLRGYLFAHQALAGL